MEMLIFDPYELCMDILISIVNDEMYINIISRIKACIMKAAIKNVYLIVLKIC